MCWNHFHINIIIFIFRIAHKNMITGVFTIQKYWLKHNIKNALHCKWEGINWTYLTSCEKKTLVNMGQPKRTWATPKKRLRSWCRLQQPAQLAKRAGRRHNKLAPMYHSSYLPLIQILVWATRFKAMLPWDLYNPL